MLQRRRSVLILLQKQYKETKNRGGPPPPTVRCSFANMEAVGTTGFAAAINAIIKINVFCNQALSSTHSTKLPYLNQVYFQWESILFVKLRLGENSPQERLSIPLFIYGITQKRVLPEAPRYIYTCLFIKKSKHYHRSISLTSYPLEGTPGRWSVIVELPFFFILERSALASSSSQFFIAYG